jgi:hypothetical protein
MVVNKVLLEACPPTEEQVTLLHPLFFLAQHEIGTPASLLLQLHLHLTFYFLLKEC